MAAAPKPCSVRAIISVNKESDKAQAKEVQLNNSNPIVYTYRYPQISPIDDNDSKEIVIAN